MQLAGRDHLYQTVWALVAACAWGFWPRKALRDQLLHWSRMSVFATVFQEPAQAGNHGMTPMIDITFLKAYRNKSARKMVTQKRSGAPEAA